MKSLTFVVVDDAVFMRTLLKRMIEETEGYKVIGEASNGIEALKKGARDFIVKPFDKSRIQQAIENVSSI